MLFRTATAKVYFIFLTYKILLNNVLIYLKIIVFMPLLGVCANSFWPFSVFQSVYKWIVKPQTGIKSNETFLPGRTSFIYNMVINVCLL